MRATTSRAGFGRLPGLVAVALLVGLIPALAVDPASASTLPAGFTDTSVMGGLGTPTAVAQLPDGRLLVASQVGTLFVVDGATKSVALDLAATSAVCSAAEMGLLGVAVDPQFASNRHIFVFYTAVTGGTCDLNGAAAGGAKNRVSRFTLTDTPNGPTAGSEVILLDNMPEWGGNHNGGDIHVAKDGTLFVAVGDGGSGRPVGGPADLSLPNGKILRINLDGTIPADNPHGTLSCKNSWGPPGAPKMCGEVYADGLRNPFRIAFDDSAAGVKFRINDVGQNTWEEVDEGIAGAHYGWPCQEGPPETFVPGPCSSPRTNPVLFYNHSTGCNVVTGGAFVPPATWPGYDGAYLFVDFGCGQLFVAQPGQTGDAAQLSPLATGIQLTTDLKFFPTDGGQALFYTTYANGGELHKVIGPAPTPPPGTIPDTKFMAVQPTRVLDTRIGLGVAAGKLAPGAAITVKVTGGDVPAGAQAVAVNLTATNADGPGFVTAWPTGAAFPETSSLNLSDFDETAANAVVVPVGLGGQINLYTRGGTHLVADVTGYFTDAGATTDGRFEAAPTPTRVLDTRTGQGGKLGPFVGGDQFDLVIAGQNGVPAGATAVALTVTYTNVAETGYVTVWPGGEARPDTSTANPNGPGDIRSNLALVSVGDSGSGVGKVSIYSHRRTDLVVDVVGWFTTRPGSEGLFTVVTPQRVADSREPGAPFPRLRAGLDAPMNFTGLAPSPSAAVLYNLTVTNTVDGGFITAHPASTPVPNASSVNWSGPDQNRAALTVSSLSSANVVGLFAKTPVDAVIDVSGWFQA